MRRIVTSALVIFFSILAASHAALIMYAAGVHALNAYYILAGAIGIAGAYALELLQDGRDLRKPGPRP